MRPPRWMADSGWWSSIRGDDGREESNWAGPAKASTRPSPMVSQTRAVLKEYAQAGGSYQEVVFENCAHTPYLEKPEEFNQLFHAHIK